jgi:serpin B
MKRSTAILAISIFTTSARAPAGETVAADGENRFAFDLYSRVMAGKENLFFSPFSIHIALAMTAAGARGATAQEMAKVLRLPPSPGARRDAGDLLHELNAPPKDARKEAYKLVLANALWGQEGIQFRKEFLELVEKKYQASLEPLDFAKAADQAAKAINEWVEKQTQGKIKDLVNPGIVRGAVLVLTNAIYFKSAWQSPFEKSATKDMPFHTAAAAAPVPMMHDLGVFGYLKGDGFQALDLTYRGGELSMTIFLPDERNGLAALEKKLSAENVAKWLAAIKPEDVDARVPRFKTTAQLSLAETLQAMGMRLAFSSAADFSGIAGGPLQVSDVVHKAYVDVNEDGTEAAAATAVVMPTSARPEPATPKVFLADHPFVYLIRHRSSGAILFLGRLMDPRG